MRSRPRPSRGPHRSRGPNGVNIGVLRPSSGNTELTDSCNQSLTTSGPQSALHERYGSVIVIVPAIQSLPQGNEFLEAGSDCVFDELIRRPPRWRPPNR